MSIVDVIGWKFNHQSGMKCEQIDGVMKIIEFPGGIPSQEEQDLWTQEYNDWISNGGLIDNEKESIADFTKVDPFLKAYVLAVNDGSIVPGMTTTQLKAAIKAKL